MNNSEWLQSLRAGDKVATCAWDHTPRIETVKKVTATQVVLDRDVRYNKTSGRRVGASNYSLRLEEVTQAIYDKIERNELEGKFNNTRARGLTLDQLRRIAAIVAETAAREAAEE